MMFRVMKEYGKRLAILATMCQTKICTNKDAAVYKAASFGINAETRQAFRFVHRLPTGYREKRISKG